MVVNVVNQYLLVSHVSVRIFTFWRKKMGKGLLKLEEIDGEFRVDSRLISERLDNEHKNVLELIRNHSSKLKKYGRVAFETLPQKTAGGIQSVSVCFLNEKQSTFLVTLAKNSDEAVLLKQDLVDSYYFYKDKGNQPAQYSIPQSYAEALQLAADQAKQLEEQKPKVNFFEKVVNADGLHDIAQVAKLLKLGYGRNTLFKKLREKKILMKNNNPYQKYVDLEYFEVKENVIKFVKKGTDEENEVLKSQTLVTGKGLTWLERKLSA